MKIIYISGIDGCGKTTQSKRLLQELRDNGLKAEYIWLRWEPSFQNIMKTLKRIKTGSSFSGIKNNTNSENTCERKWLGFKRNILANRMLRNLWLTYACCDYYLAYRRKFKHLKNIVVVIDRYIDDFIIDQAVNCNLHPEKMSFMRDNIFLRSFPLPDYKIIIDLPAVEGYKRKSDGTPLSYLEAREKYYLAIKGPDTLHLNGLDNVDDLAVQIKTWVIDRLEAEGS